MGPSIIKRLYEQLFQISFFDLITICVCIVHGSLVVTKICHKTAAYSHIKQIASETVRPHRSWACFRASKKAEMSQEESNLTSSLDRVISLSNCRSVDKATLQLQLSFLSVCGQIKANQKILINLTWRNSKVAYLDYSKMGVSHKNKSRSYNSLKNIK